MPAPSYMSAFQPTLPARGATCCRISHTSTRQPFQPTLPARGATDTTFSGVCPTSFQPTLPARGATGLCADCHQKRAISTHAPRTGSDIANHVLGQALAISTHAPRTGSDAELFGGWAVAVHFNPRSPHGERRGTIWRLGGCCAFQPTLPARGATLTGWNERWNSGISTHAPRTGSDAATANTAARSRFQPTLPARGATTAGGDVLYPGEFQPTLPARGATR